MSKEREQDSIRKACSLQEIPKWAERYVYNRSLPVLVGLGLTLGIMAVSMAFTLYAVESKVIALIIASIALNIMFTAGVLYLMITGRWMAIVRWPERLEGMAVPVLPSPEELRRRRRFDWLLPLPLIVVLVVLKVLDVPEQYWQPMTAIYVVPAFVYLVAHDRWVAWPHLLCPALYLLHAILLLVGAKLYIGVWYMDVFFALGVYAVAGLIAAQIYSRYALRRLRDVAAGCDSEVE